MLRRGPFFPSRRTAVQAVTCTRPVFNATPTGPVLIRPSMKVWPAPHAGSWWHRREPRLHCVGAALHSYGTIASPKIPTLPAQVRRPPGHSMSSVIS